MMQQSALTRQLRQEIANHPNQSISFQRFMELSLYHKTEGYYVRDRQRFGKQGDFFTNVQVGALFGQWLAHIFGQTLARQTLSERWAVVEMGAGEGRLMEQLLDSWDLQAAPFDQADFYIVERGQSQNLPEIISERVTWVETLTEIPRYPFALIYSNELVDAFPVYRLRKVAGQIQEVHVTWDAKANTFAEIMQPCSLDLHNEVSQLADQLSEQQSMELNLDAKAWLTDLANWMNAGFVFTIDYGGTQADLLFRQDGTVRFIQQHQLLANPYDAPGEVDITTHVNFSQLRDWGAALGLSEVFYGSQAQFLLSEPYPYRLTSAQIKAFKQLVHPDAMGESFHVLVQQKSADCPIHLG